MFCLLNEVKPCSAGLVLAWVTKFESPCSNNVSFFLFYVILKNAEIASLRNIVSSLYQLFVARFAIAVFMCIYLHYHIHKQRDTLFKLYSILWTVDLSKHLITAWIVKKFIQRDNSVTFSVFFSFFGNRVWLNLYERALSCFQETRILIYRFRPA